MYVIALARIACALDRAREDCLTCNAVRKDEQETADSFHISRHWPGCSASVRRLVVINSESRISNQCQMPGVVPSASEKYKRSYCLVLNIILGSNRTIVLAKEQ